MEIPNYDSKEGINSGFKRLKPYMLQVTLRMLICGNSGSGKTNIMYDMLMKPLVYCDQDKYQNMMN